MLTRDPETDFEHNTGDSDPRARMDADSAAQRERVRISLRRRLASMLHTPRHRE